MPAAELDDLLLAYVVLLEALVRVSPSLARCQGSLPGAVGQSPCFVWVLSLLPILQDGPAKVIDPSEARKKLANKAGGKKKKAQQVNPAIARAAAEEAKVRATKEAAQREKDKKKNYNQERR